MAVGTVSSINYDNWQLITSTTPSGSSVTFNNFSGYKTLWVVGNVTKSDSSHTRIRPNNDTTVSSYANAYAASAFYLIDGSPRAISFKIYDVDRAIPHKVDFVTNIVGGETTNSDAYTVPDVITSLVLSPDSGTFTGGTLRLYGIAS